MQNARRSRENFSPVLNMKHTVFALGPSIAGFGRLPVLTFSTLGAADLVVVIAI
jgi:hypothetical protein